MAETEIARDSPLPAMAALRDVVRDYIGAYVEEGYDTYNYHPPTKEDRGEIRVPRNDVGGLVHEIAHWVVGMRHLRDYGVGHPGTGVWSDFQEIWAGALASYWMVAAGRSESAPSLGSGPHLPQLEVGVRFSQACKHMGFFMSLCPPGLSSRVIAALRLDGGDHDELATLGITSTETLAFMLAQTTLTRWRREGLRRSRNAPPPYAAKWYSKPSGMPPQAPRTTRRTAKLRNRG